MIFNVPYSLPPIGHPGAFGTRRKHDVHTGVDLYVPEHTLVYAGEKGTIVAIEEFTGPNVGSPWWNTTYAVLVEGFSGVCVYGEIDPHPWISVGNTIDKGQGIGHVLRVLRKDKGTPTSMLHFELMRHGHYYSSPVWYDAMPEELLDPTETLERWNGSR